MLSRELQVTLQLAVTEAVNRRHEYVCLEHLLYAMLHDVTTSNILQNSGADLEELKKKLARYLDEQVERMPKGETVMPRYAIGVQRALQRAALHVQSSGRNEINGGNVLVAMFHETESPAYFFLQEQNVSRFDVINFISHGVSKIAEQKEDAGGTEEAEGEHEAEGGGGEEDGDRKVSPSKALKTYAINLTERAAQGKIDPLVGREKELERAIHVLLRRRKNNPIFVGEAGVGKTALAEGLALAVHDGKVPDALQGRGNLCARHGCAAGWNAISRRLRAASQGRHQGGGREHQKDSLHRRDPYYRRCGLGLGQHDGCLQPAQASARVRAIYDASGRLPTRNINDPSIAIRRSHVVSSVSMSTNPLRKRPSRSLMGSSRITKNITT